MKSVNDDADFTLQCILGFGFFVAILCLLAYLGMSLMPAFVYDGQGGFFMAPAMLLMFGIPLVQAMLAGGFWASKDRKDNPYRLHFWLNVGLLSAAVLLLLSQVFLGLFIAPPPAR